MDREGLWYKLLSSRYSGERRQIKDGGRDEYAWMQDIVKIHEGVGIEMSVGLMREFK